MMKRDLQSREDIVTLVDEFYTKVRHDNVIGAIFEHAIGDNWDKHLDKMYRFWDTVLFNSKAYVGNPFMVHSKLNIGEKHFDIWLEYFNETADERFSGENVERMKLQASKMAIMFLRKLKEYDNHQNRKPLI